MARIIKRGLLAAAVVLVVVLIAVAAIVWRSMAPTSGPRIAHDAGRKALLVVDIQEDYTGPRARKPYRDGARIVEATNRLIDAADRLELVVVYVENQITNPVIRLLAGGMNAPDAPGTRVDARVHRQPGARTFGKGRSDAFGNPALDAHLRELRVGELLVVGLDGAYCVDATVRGARNRGYAVTVVTDGVATESGRSLDALARGYAEAGAKLATSATLLAAAGAVPR